jgi:hypothetical protein
MLMGAVILARTVAGVHDFFVIRMSRVRARSRLRLGGVPLHAHTMNTSRRKLLWTSTLPFLMGTGLLATPAVVPAQTPPPPVGVRGTITRVSNDVIQVQTKRGEDLAIHLNDKTQVRAVTLASIGEIKPGSYIGTAAVPQPDGSLKALEIHVFPPAMVGTGEGHRAWDLEPNSTMTNGTVGDVVAANGHTLTVRYKGGEKKIVVPDDVPIVNMEPGDRSLLTVGTKVVLFARKEADGSLWAGFISAGKNGIAPPM